jgi:hypothetical protein
MPAPADSQLEGALHSPRRRGQPIELPLKDGVYETPELPVGTYDVQVVDAFGQAVGAPSPSCSAPAPPVRTCASRWEGRDGRKGDKGGSWKVWAIVGGAAAALALAAGGGDGGSDAPASPVN